MEIAEKLEKLEKDIQDLRALVLLGNDALYEKKLVSLRGMGKILVSEEELNESIEKARHSLFRGVEDTTEREEAKGNKKQKRKEEELNPAS
ncbi:MAG: hypothetical protein HXS40_09670 [Theionarchaea archaeon]|nr:hypothetical protein [Theionarchaea archaeon]